MVSADAMTSAGLPIITTVAAEMGIPVFHPSVGAIRTGATIAAGYSSYYARGDNIGVMLAAYLNGDLDIARTAIHVDSGSMLGVNLGTAAMQGVEVAQELIEQADVFIASDSPIPKLSPKAIAEFTEYSQALPLEERLEKDQAFLASLQCSDEMIAEQQAALDAAE